MFFNTWTTHCSIWLYSLFFFFCRRPLCEPERKVELIWLTDHRRAHTFSVNFSPSVELQKTARGTASHTLLSAPTCVWVVQPPLLLAQLLVYTSRYLLRAFGGQRYSSDVLFVCCLLLRRIPAVLELTRFAVCCLSNYLDLNLAVAMKTDTRASVHTHT